MNLFSPFHFIPVLCSPHTRDGEGLQPGRCCRIEKINLNWFWMLEILHIMESFVSLSHLSNNAICWLMSAALRTRDLTLMYQSRRERGTMLVCTYNRREILYNVRARFVAQFLESNNERECGKWMRTAVGLALLEKGPVCTGSISRDAALLLLMFQRPV